MSDTSVRGSRTGRPIMALLDLLGRRWALRVLWELNGGPLTSRALRAACDDVSPSVLQTRIRDLTSAALITRDAGGYRLTELGRALVESFTPLYLFADRWAAARAEES